MANILRSLLLLILAGILLTLLSAYQFIHIGFSHIALSIPLILMIIFSQAFIMFYFIGVHRLVENVMNVLHSKTDLYQLFDEPPSDLNPYLKEVNLISYQTSLCKRQTIPWSALILVLGILAFLLGAAYHTGQVEKPVHVGVVYGFLTSFSIGFFKQWKYLGKAHILLRKLKATFNLSDDRM